MGRRTPSLRAGPHGACAVLAAALLATAVPAGTAAAASSTAWKIQQTVNTTVPNGVASAVSCPSASACMAVGSYRNTSGVPGPLAEAWNGTAWKVAAAAVPAGASTASLAAVSCRSGTSCEAVGAQAGSSGTTALAEAWNGTTWASQSVAGPAGGTDVKLTGVSCTAAHSCEAVGSYENSASVQVMLAEKWNGTKWAIQATPAPKESSHASLAGVSCPAAADCEAVGTGSQGPFAEAWNGTSWSAQSVPTPSGITNDELAAVSCASGSFCAAAGFGVNSSSEFVALAETWNGKSWTGQAPPGPSGAATTELQAVSCHSASFCEAAGYTTSLTGFVPLGEAWNGKAWAIQHVPGPAGAYDAGLAGISCPAASSCEAAGSFAAAANPGVLADRWNGKSWALQAAPTPEGAIINSFSGVSCVSAADCEAVGSHYNPAGEQVPLAEKWNGAGWALQTTAHPAGADTTYLSAVSCVGASFCEAVGGSSGTSGAYAETWDGSTWKPQSVGGDAALTSVSCVSASFCVAVGATGAEVWHGASWSAQKLPYPGSPPNGNYLAVSCASTKACEAVGGPDSAGAAFAASWNGTSWSLQKVSSPSGDISASLAAVSCAAARACEAVGSQEQRSGSLPLAEAWNGTTWKNQAVPLPASGKAGSLAGVSCTSASACTAAGSYNSGTAQTQLTLAEARNGSSWTAQSTKNPYPADDAFGAVSCGAAGACTAVGSAPDPGGTETATLAEAGG